MLGDTNNFRTIAIKYTHSGNNQLVNLPKVNLHKFKNLFKHPNWNYIHQFIVTTRNYDNGLIAILYLIDKLEIYKSKLTSEEYDNFGSSLYLFFLHLLDRADRWEDYLQVWDQLRNTTKFYHNYIKSAKYSHSSEFQEFILDETDNSLHVHFLYGTIHRKKIIEKKVFKKKEGKKLKNLYHSTIDELTEDEIKERIAWLNKIFQVDI